MWTTIPVKLQHGEYGTCNFQRGMFTRYQTLPTCKGNTLQPKGLRGKKSDPRLQSSESAHNDIVQSVLQGLLHLVWFCAQIYDPIVGVYSKYGHCVLIPHFRNSHMLLNDMVDICNVYLNLNGKYKHLKIYFA